MSKRASVPVPVSESVSVSDSDSEPDSEPEPEPEPEPVSVSVSVSVLMLGLFLLLCASCAPSDHAQPLARAHAQPPAPSATPPTRSAAAPFPAPTAAVQSAPTTATAPLRFAGTDFDQDVLLAALSRAEPVSFKSVGSSATVFRTRFAGSLEAAFKSATRERPHGPESEVAAYRLARCLRMDNVPPAVSRDFPASRIHAALDAESAARWPQILERIGVGENDVVHGATIYWIPVLAEVGLDKHSSLDRVSAWLRLAGKIEPAEQSLAASVSNMLAFDYLIANFDRWSGANVRGDAEATRVYVRDHDLAFPVRIGDKLQRRLLDDLTRAERFSRAFYANLQQLDRACFERELAADPRGARGELLSQGQIADVFDRRQTLLSHIESLIALHGEKAVLAFE
jgi:hypothetical protein